MADKIQNQVCQKCGFDHNAPGSTVGAIQVLVCALAKDDIEIHTRYGQVRPMTVMPLDKRKGAKTVEDKKKD